MRIRYWSGRFDLDDIEDCAARLAPALAARGHEVALIAPVSERPADAIVSERLSIHRIDVDGRIDSNDLLPAPAREAPDVDLAEVCSPLDALTAATTDHADGALVTSIHCPLPDTTHQEGSPVGALLRAATASAVDSEAIAGQLRAFVPEQADRTMVIRAGLPLTELAPGPRLVKRPRLLCAGRLTRDSGFDIAIEALASIRERIKTAELVIVGEGPERAALEGQATDLGIGSAVSFRERVAGSRLPGLVNQASLVVVPARAPLSSCAIAILAGQLLRPVIATAVGGLPEIIEPDGSACSSCPRNRRRSPARPAACCQTRAPQPTSGGADARSLASASAGTASSRNSRRCCSRRSVKRPRPPRTRG